MSFSASLSGHLNGDDAGVREQEIANLFADFVEAAKEAAKPDTLSGAYFSGQFTGGVDHLSEPTVSADAGQPGQETAPAPQPAPVPGEAQQAQPQG